jgi:hypothetical protein
LYLAKGWTASSEVDVQKTFGDFGWEWLCTCVAVQNMGELRMEERQRGQVASEWAQ